MSYLRPPDHDVAAFTDSSYVTGRVYGQHPNNDLKQPLLPHNVQLQPYHEQTQLPKVGQTRCYWTLLNSSLHFLALDPVLTYHLQEQAPLLLEKCLLDFVHPEEQASARHDLGGVLQERTLHGTVTRVRFCRLSRVRRLLGWQPSSSAPLYPPSFPAERIAIDGNYMAVDIVINWAAEGIVLCFIHAVVDLLPREDNDETLKTGWSNWCGTTGFGQEQAHALYQHFTNTVTQTHFSQPSADTSIRVFQILRNDPDRFLILSWPPDPASACRDRPSAHELARLALQVQIGAGVYGQGHSNAKTSCTRRYKSVQSIPLFVSDDCKSAQIESIFIPHGSIVFACHKIDVIRSPATNGWQSSFHHNQQLDSHDTLGSYPTSQQSQPHRPEFFTDNGSSYMSYLPTHSGEASAEYAEQWVAGQTQTHYQQHWLAPECPSPSSSSGINSRPGSGSTNEQTYEHGWSAPSPVYHDSPEGHGPTDERRAESPTHYSAAPDATSFEPPENPSPTTNYLRADAPPPQVAAAHSTVATLSSGTSVGGESGSCGRDSPISTTSESLTPSTGPHRRGRHSSHGTTGNSREHYTSSGRNAGNPPTGVTRCTSCKISQSPEWRKGPSGKKDLCNACGLRYARSRAKREGVAPRRRKEKSALTPMPTTGSTSAVEVGES
ncbi:hypothetical protein BD410DRAFT_784439 [Rickenella mellea]|uniref:GATA-type domain-containing protein n=1 Tax=Rickenella mellea TaxID=50990 RepID=A0A4Y7QCP7_9AGAM|nr:hypothetical protein BD410DRAFT_784439 [Rickenella mellea]